MKRKRFLFGKQQPSTIINQDRLALGNKTVKVKLLGNPSKMDVDRRRGEAVLQDNYPDEAVARRMDSRERKAKLLLFKREVKRVFGWR